MKKEIGKYVSEELRSLRSIANETVEEVSKSTNLNKDTIYRYEKDASCIKLYILDILLKHYETNIFIFIANIYDRLQNRKEVE